MNQTLKISASSEKKKLLHLEVLRIVACFSVIFIHTQYNGFFLFSCYPFGSLQYWIYMFISIFLRFPIPLFWAISGALIIPKDETFSQLYSKRIFKTVITLILSSALYYILFNRSDLSVLHLKDFFRILYTSVHSFHLWYLYSYLGFLALCPLLRPLIRNMENTHFLYMIILYLVFRAVIPITEYFLWQGRNSLNPYIGIGNYLSDMIVGAAAGYYLEHKIDLQRAKKHLSLIWVFYVLTVLIACFATHYKVIFTGICEENVSEDFHEAFSLVGAVVLYITAKVLFDRHRTNERMTRILTSVGSSTLGIYILHIAVLYHLNHYYLIENFRNTTGINAMICCFLYCLLVMAISYVLAVVIKYAVACLLFFRKHWKKPDT